MLSTQPVWAADGSFPRTPARRIAQPQALAHEARAYSFSHCRVVQLAGPGSIAPNAGPNPAPINASQFGRISADGSFEVVSPSHANPKQTTAPPSGGLGRRSLANQATRPSRVITRLESEPWHSQGRGWSEGANLCLLFNGVARCGRFFSMPALRLSGDGGCSTSLTCPDGLAV